MGLLTQNEKLRLAYLKDFYELKNIIDFMELYNDYKYNNKEKFIDTDEKVIKYFESIYDKFMKNPREISKILTSIKVIKLSIEDLDMFV